MSTRIFLLTLLCLSLWACKKDEPTPEPESRSFKMGFTTWPYGPNIEDVNDTYAFLENNGDIYSEHIDNNIPWNALINDLPLPAEFTDGIEYKASNRLPDTELLLSVSLLNLERSDLAEDFDGSTPDYTSMSDDAIEDAYFAYLQYLILQFNPNYLVAGIEVNELYIHSPEKWEGYKDLMQAVILRVRAEYPDLQISESMTLHNLYLPDIDNPDAYLEEMVDYLNAMDFVAISFYPFFKNLHTKADFQGVFDFLHQRVNRPIAFVETCTIAEDLIVPNLNLSISGSEAEQNIYLETLLENAQAQNYKFVIWWAHRDYDALWVTFPSELSDLGRLWRDTGLLDEDGNERMALNSWSVHFAK